MFRNGSERIQTRRWQLIISSAASRPPPSPGALRPHCIKATSPPRKPGNVTREHNKRPLGEPTNNNSPLKLLTATYWRPVSAIHHRRSRAGCLSWLLRNSTHSWSLRGDSSIVAARTRRKRKRMRSTLRIRRLLFRNGRPPSQPSSLPPAAGRSGGATCSQCRLPQVHSSLATQGEPLTQISTPTLGQNLSQPPHTLA